jgi:hypothetical protein
MRSRSIDRKEGEKDWIESKLNDRISMRYRQE